MRKFLIGTSLACAAATTGCAADRTDQAAQDMIQELEGYGIEEALIQKPVRTEAGDMSAVVAVAECEVVIVNTGAELRIVAVDGESIGYEPDLEGVEQLKGLCEGENAWDALW